VFDGKQTAIKVVMQYIRDNLMSSSALDKVLALLDFRELVLSSRVVVARLSIFRELFAERFYRFAHLLKTFAGMDPTSDQLAGVFQHPVPTCSTKNPNTMIAKG
jgi:hypothetical protein